MRDLNGQGRHGEPIRWGWLPCALVAATLACTESGGPGEGRSLQVRRDAVTHTQGQELQGQELQGQELQGQELQGHELSGVTLSGGSLENVRVVQGGLVADRKVPVTGTTASLSPCTSPTTGLSRSCGWTSAGVGSCSPGAQVTVGASAACGLGSCSGNAMMRVCDGQSPCEHGGTAMLGASNDACDSSCPAVTFSCPSSGRYNVMTASYDSAESSSSAVAASAGTFPLRETLSGTQLAGAQLYGTAVDYSTSPPTQTTVTFRVASVQPELSQYAGAGDTFLYRVEQYLPGTGGWADICKQDKDGNRVAIPVGAVFDATGARLESSSKFTFACTTGVIAKCYRWGYKPWLTHPNDPDLFKQAHWACTRMARADYCGNGKSHTQDGTLINLWDNLPPPGPIQQHGPAVSGMIFEAGWNTGGAVCLSKERWSSLPPEVQTACPNKLIPPGVSTGNATVCKSDADAKVFSPKPLLFNESYLNVQ